MESGHGLNEVSVMQEPLKLLCNEISIIIKYKSVATLALLTSGVLQCNITDNNLSRFLI